MSYDEVLWEMSYANVNMLLATIPKYEKPKTDDEKGSGEKVQYFDSLDSLKDIIKNQ